MPVLMSEIRHFPAEAPAAASQPAPEVLAQEKLPLTSKYHFGNWNTQSELQETHGQWRLRLARTAGVKLKEKNRFVSEGSLCLIEKPTTLGKFATQTFFSSVAVVITPFD